jgi:NAD-dependent SIR2 family protein deacetylase
MTNDGVVELHGTLHELVCQSCGHIYPTKAVIQTTNSILPATNDQSHRKKLAPRGANTTIIIPPNCRQCENGKLRFRVLMYDDEQWHKLMSHEDEEPLVNLLPHDLEAANFVLWMGISFHQQASCQHFQEVWDAGGDRLIHFLVNPQATQACENLETAIVVANSLGFADNVIPVEITSNDLFAQLAN